MTGRRTMLFIDEIHRFNKSQQDALLHAVEDRLVVLIGATTENPFFEVNAPLISRSRVVEFAAARRRRHPRRSCAVRSPMRSEGSARRSRLEPEALDLHRARLQAAMHVSRSPRSNSRHSSRDDARRRCGNRHVDEVTRATAVRALPYDKTGDVHYDVISAFIKSMRGSDPDAAVYWLARMVHGGEDPKFIARRMLIFASEDVGMADPAGAAGRARRVQGRRVDRLARGAHQPRACGDLPGARPQEQRGVSRDRRGACARSGRATARLVPDHLRDRHRPGADAYPAYQYPHDHPGARVEQQYLPDGLVGRRYYRPTAADDVGRERPRRPRSRTVLTTAFATLSGYRAARTQGGSTWTSQARSSIALTVITIVLVIAGIYVRPSCCVKARAAAARGRRGRSQSARSAARQGGHHGGRAQCRVVARGRASSRRPRRSGTRSSTASGIIRTPVNVARQGRRPGRAVVPQVDEADLVGAHRPQGGPMSQGPCHADRSGARRVRADRADDGGGARERGSACPTTRWTTCGWPPRRRSSTRASCAGDQPDVTFVFDPRRRRTASRGRPSAGMLHSRRRTHYAPASYAEFILQSVCDEFAVAHEARRMHARGSARRGVVGQETYGA